MVLLCSAGGRDRACDFAALRSAVVQVQQLVHLLEAEPQLLGPLDESDPSTASGGKSR